MQHQQKILKVSVAALVSLISFFLAMFICFYIGEKYFFDKLFYRKSAIFGYYQNQEYWSLPKSDENFLIKRRTQDIQDLVDIANGKREALQLDKKVYKVAVIGDSFAYGMGVKDGQQFPKILEKRLNQLKPTKVYNLSLSGDSIFDNFTKYQLAEKYLKPDIYVIATLDNDLQIDTYDKYPTEEETFAELKSHCPQPEFNKELPSDVTYEDMVSKFFVPEYSDEYANMCYTKFISQTMAQNVLFMMMLRTLDYSATNPDKEPPLTDKLKEVLAENHQVIDPYQMKNFEYKMISDKENHPSAATQAEYADILFQIIQKRMK